MLRHFQSKKVFTSLIKYPAMRFFREQIGKFGTSDQIKRLNQLREFYGELSFTIEHNYDSHP